VCVCVCVCMCVRACVCVAFMGYVTVGRKISELEHDIKMGIAVSKCFWTRSGSGSFPGVVIRFNLVTILLLLP
jgi:hypothetical protein